MAKNKFEQSLENGTHKLLSDLVGDWKGSNKTWFKKDVLAEESSLKGQISPILGNRFISFDYEGTLYGKSFEGKMIIGYDIPYQRFTISWIDGFHMGTQIMLSSGAATEKGFSVLGYYGSPEYGDELWGWRTEFIILSGDEIIISAYNISPEGEETKATETILNRIL